MVPFTINFIIDMRLVKGFSQQNAEKMKMENPILLTIRELTIREEKIPDRKYPFSMNVRTSVIEKKFERKRVRVC